MGVLWSYVVALWNIGNHYLRWGIILLLTWPFFVVLVALVGVPTITALVALIIPIVGLLLLLGVWLDPLVLAAIGAFSGGRRALRWMATILAVEFCIGVYFTIVPIHHLSGLAPLLLLTTAALLFFAIGVQNARSRMTMLILAIIIAVITLIFLWGSIAELFEKAVGALQKPSALTLWWMFGFVILAIIWIAAIAKRSFKSWASAATVTVLLLIILIIGDRLWGRIDLGDFGGGGGRIYVQAGQEVRLPLLGYDKWTKTVVTPPGTKRIWSGPASARVRYTDGTEGPLGKTYGKTKADPQFSGPEGEVVIIKVERR